MFIATRAARSNKLRRSGMCLSQTGHRRRSVRAKAPAMPLLRSLARRPETVVTMNVALLAELDWPVLLASKPIRQHPGQSARGLCTLHGYPVYSWCPPERREIIQPRATPWEYRQHESQALKGRHIVRIRMPRFPVPSQHGGNGSTALSGLRLGRRIFPGRCPGLYCCGLSGLSFGHSRDACGVQRRVSRHSAPGI